GLHSFPTRRSSDLFGRGGAGGNGRLLRPGGTACDFVAFGRGRFVVVIRRSWAVLLSLVLAALLGTAASAQTLQLPSIVTIGLGFVVIPADHLVVTLNIEPSDESAQAAYAASAAIVDAIREEL